MRLLLKVILLSTLLLGGYSLASPPDTSVKQALEKRYGRLGTVEILSAKHFESEGSGIGRTSVAGKVTFPEPLYVLKRDALPTMLAAKGIPQYEVDYVAKQLQLIPQGAIYSYSPPVYEVSVRAGQSISFTAELMYREGAQSFDVSVAGVKPGITGKLRSELTSQSLIDGSDELAALVKRIERASAAHRAYVAEVRGQIEKSLVSRHFFLSKPDSVYDDPLIWRDRYTVDVADTMSWAQSTPYLHRFEVPATVEILKETRFDGKNRSPGERFSTRITGGINIRDGRGMWLEFDGTLKPIEGAVGFADNYTRLVETATVELPPDPVDEPEWRVATVSKARVAKFNLRSSECMQVRPADVASGTTLIFFDDRGDGRRGVAMGEAFTIEGPKRRAGIGYSGAGQAQFQYWTYRKSKGRC
jgi:hypothetical protein